MAARKQVTTLETSMKLAYFAMEQRKALQNRTPNEIEAIFKKEFPKDYFSISVVKDICKHAGIDITRNPRAQVAERTDRIRILAEIVLRICKHMDNISDSDKDALKKLSQGIKIDSE